MQRRFEPGKQEGSITLFLALVLTLVLSLCFSLLEAGRVQGLAALAQRNLQLNLASVFGRYHVQLWQDYHLLFLDGSKKEGEFSLAGLEGTMAEEDGKSSVALVLSLIHI